MDQKQFVLDKEKGEALLKSSPPTKPAAYPEPGSHPDSNGAPGSVELIPYDPFGEGRKNLIAAIAKFQSEIKAVERNAENPHLKKKYADLAAVFDAIRDPMARNGLAITQVFRREGSFHFLRTTVWHTSGESFYSEVPIILGGRNDMQGLGSAITYARRYGLMPLLGVVAKDEDDDGEAVKRDQQNRNNNRQQNSQRQQVRGNAGKPGENPTPPPAKQQTPGRPNDKQLARLFSIASGAGWEKQDVATFLKTKLNKTSSRDLTIDEYNKLCKYIEENKKVDQRSKAAGETSEAPPIESDPEGDPTSEHIPGPPESETDDIPW